jgi:hypothetical protein
MSKVVNPDALDIRGTAEIVPRLPNLRAMTTPATRKYELSIYLGALAKLGEQLPCRR